MNKVLLGASLAVTLLVAACSQGPVEVQGGLEPQFGSPRDDYADVVTTDAQRGRVYVAGAFTGPENTGRGDVLFFRRYHRDGSLAWKVSANTEAPGGIANATAADIDPSGNVYFGWSTLAGTGTPVNRAFISKYTPTGKLLFRKELPKESLNGLATDASGNVYVTATNYSEAGRTFRARKYTGSGSLVWTKELRVPDEDFGDDMGDVSGLDIAPDGSVFIAAARQSYGGLLFKLRGSDGKQLKLSPVGGQFALDVEVTGASAYVYSFFDAPYDNQPIVTKFRLDGASVWERRGLYEGDKNFSDARYDAATGGISADTQGNVYLVGTFVIDMDGSVDPNVLVRKYTPSGSVAYNRRFIDPGTDAYGRGVAASGGELYVVGSTDGLVNGKTSGGREAFLMRLNAQGQRVWER